MVTRTKAPVPPASPAKTSGEDRRRRENCRILIIEARFYQSISDELAAGAIEELEAQGADFELVTVPGALEIPQVLAQVAHAGAISPTSPVARFAGAIALGCVIRGETGHYDIVANNANHWLMEIAIGHAIPVGNGILTVETEAQAIARARGGREGKGGDAARACLRLVDTARAFEGQDA